MNPFPYSDEWQAWRDEKQGPGCQGSRTVGIWGWDEGALSYEGNSKLNGDSQKSASVSFIPSVCGISFHGKRQK